MVRVWDEFGQAFPHQVRDRGVNGLSGKAHPARDLGHRERSFGELDRSHHLPARGGESLLSGELISRGQKEIGRLKQQPPAAEAAGRASLTHGGKRCFVRSSRSVLTSQNRPSLTGRLTISRRSESTEDGALTGSREGGKPTFRWLRN